ncbi:MAG: cobalamin biosynthesis central domain-containing protein [SAR324 cluster bacterium]|nr:cobalamin biosynthesis central domain-containing protein [SAR324 cluster bacterium]
MTKQKVVFVAITKSGAQLCNRLAPQFPDADFKLMAKVMEHCEGQPNCSAIEGSVKQAVGDVFAAYEQLVFVVSIGAVVRLIAPHLKSKETDPGVVVIDDVGDFVIPVLSGHQGGANAFAEEIAAKLEAQVVFTTASEVGKTIAVDILGRELGWEVVAPKVNLVRVAADVVNQEKIALVQEAGGKDWWTRSTPIPTNITLFESFEEVDMNQFKSLLWITDREVPESLWSDLKERLVVYRPPKG